PCRRQAAVVLQGSAVPHDRPAVAHELRVSQAAHSVLRALGAALWPEKKARPFYFCITESSAARTLADFLSSLILASAQRPAPVLASARQVQLSRRSALAREAEAEDSNFKQERQENKGCRIDSSEC